MIPALPGSSDLAAVVDALAALAGGVAAVEDADGRLVARSHAGPDGDVRREHRVPPVVTVEIAPEHGRRLAIGVYAESEYLGAITVTEDGAPLDPEAAAALAYSARVAARHLTARRADGDPDRADRRATLRALLYGGAAGPAASDLGLDATGTFVVVAFEVAVADGADPGIAAGRLLRALSLCWTALRREAHCLAAGGVVHTLLPTTARDRLADVARLAAKQAGAALGRPVRAGIGPVVSGAHEVARSRHLAEQVLRVLALDPERDPVADLDDVRSTVLLLELSDAVAADPRLCLDPVLRIARHDAAHRTAYVPTLRAYLDAFGDVKAASSRVCVHVKTFRYRLRRIAELSGLRLSDPQERLAVHLNLRLIDRLNPPPPVPRP